MLLLLSLKNDRERDLVIFSQPYYTHNCSIPDQRFFALVLLLVCINNVSRSAKYIPRKNEIETLISAKKISGKRHRNTEALVLAWNIYNFPAHLSWSGNRHAKEMRWPDQIFVAIFLCLTNRSVVPGSGHKHRTKLSCSYSRFSV